MNATENKRYDSRKCTDGPDLDLGTIKSLSLAFFFFFFFRKVLKMAKGR